MLHLGLFPRLYYVTFPALCLHFRLCIPSYCFDSTYLTAFTYPHLSRAAGREAGRPVAKHRVCHRSHVVIVFVSVSCRLVCRTPASLE
jgi:hypothetical protein